MTILVVELLVLPESLAAPVLAGPRVDFSLKLTRTRVAITVTRQSETASSDYTLREQDRV